MLLDELNTLAKATTLASPEHLVIDLGPKGMGKGGDINFYIEMTVAAAGLTSCNWKLYVADDEDGTTNKNEILATPEFLLASLVKGFMFSTPIPDTSQRYLILELNVTGTATAGTYWAGLTSGHQYGYHNHS